MRARGIHRVFMWMGCMLFPGSLPVIPGPGEATSTNLQGEISGVVLGPGGKPVAGAWVEAGAMSVRTDEKGQFSLNHPNRGSVRIFAKGLEPQTREGRPGERLLVLLEPEVKGAVVEVVEGSGYGTEGTASTAITRMEIYTTPGAAADVFQAAKALPGVSNASEGAELFVRGGKPDEVGIFMDGGRLAHPYHHPNAQGGLFTSVDTAVVSSLNFIPGGFSARYGDALSAVMELSTETGVPRRAGTILSTLANAGIAHDEVMAEGQLRVSLRHASPELLDRWYNMAARFEEAPISDDAFLSYQRSLPGGGRMVFSALQSADHLGVEGRMANAAGIYQNRSRQSYSTGSWYQPMGDKALLSLTASRTNWSSRWDFNTWGMDQRESSSFYRAELSFQANDELSLEGGLDGDQKRYEPQGRVPFDLANWSATAPERRFAYAFDGRRFGGYATLRWRLNRAWGLSLGARRDRYELLDRWTTDGRMTLSWQIQDGLVLRLAGGSFSQAPPLSQLDPFVGNPKLAPLRATHALAALDAKGEGWQIRLETYRKNYRELVLEDAVQRYISGGRGYAQGLDLLLKGRLGAWTGWLGYGYLDTRRQEGKQAQLGLVPTSVPHNLTAALTFNLRSDLQISSAWRAATGAPVTPILGGFSDAHGEWQPLEGPRYSDRLPTYGRVDLRLTHLFPWKAFRGVVFLEIMNLLDKHNIAGYSYSADYKTRRSEESTFSRRMLVAGLSLSW